MPRSSPKRWEHTLGGTGPVCPRLHQCKSVALETGSPKNRRGPGSLWVRTLQSHTPFTGRTGPGSQGPAGTHTCLSARRALPGPEARAPGIPSPPPPPAYLTRGAAETEDRGRRRREDGATRGEIRRLPQITARRTEVGARSGATFPSFLRLASATSYQRLARRRVKPHFPEGCAFARALWAPGENGACAFTRTRTPSVKRTAGPASACFLGTGAPRARNYTSQKVMRPRKTFRVAGQLARTPSCGAVDSPPVGVLPPEVSVLRPGPLLGSPWGLWAFDARLPGTVVPKTPCVRAVMATVVGGQTTLPGHSCGRVTAVDCRRLVYRSQQWRPQGKSHFGVVLATVSAAWRMRWVRHYFGGTPAQRSPVEWNGWTRSTSEDERIA
uniref:uncharacterized protein LOC129500149 n=1 Tax=Nyctereutes procyonoides TaxID=34880 RepID=UPI002444D776|nr:uncharacterized protein LOC129500149 [Nyctereutes procyonoides]